MRAHIAAVHKGIIYKCYICGQTFRNKGANKSHKSSKHDKKSLINYSKEEMRRVDFTFGIAYGESVEKARKLILDIFNEDDRILHEPAEPFVALSAMADSSVNLAARVWAKGENYWPVFFETNEKVYKAMNEAGINIPFPQMDVHLINDSKK